MLRIIPLTEEHYPDVARIYKEGLDTGIASFETEVPDWLTWNKKFLPNCRFIILKNDLIAGWCALSSVSKRAVYNGVAEDTIYISNKFQGKGLGKALLAHLIEESEKEGFWTLQAGIFSENKPSINLHKDLGFRTVGIREKIAQRNGKWHDNVFMERRSNIK